MGTNVVRLVRSDHRRISELLARLNSRHRGGTALQKRVANELTAHVTACRDSLLPFAESRVHLDRSAAESLDRLQRVAGELRESAGAVPAATIATLVEAMDHHIDTEERDVLRPLEDTVTVDRLRRLGESFRRTRDAAMRAEGGSQRRQTRPPASRAELYEQARYRKIAGRSSMSKAELLAALKEQQ
ncbi:MAG TPA: hypothetical protein VFZ37_09710 [Jiangellaceae bacterium]